MMNEKMIAKLESKGFKRWTKGTADRLYVDCYALGLENGRWATMGGYDLSHADTRRVKAAKTYIDVQTGELVSDEWHCEEAAKAIYDAVIAECEAEEETEGEDEKEPMEYYDMESFGADCPANWQDIASWLNAKLTERVTADMDDRDIREIADAIWEAYWGGEYAEYDAPAPSEELWEDMD